MGWFKLFVPGFFLEYVNAKRITYLPIHILSRFLLIQTTFNILLYKIIYTHFILERLLKINKNKWGGQNYKTLVFIHKLTQQEELQGFEVSIPRTTGAKYSVVDSTSSPDVLQIDIELSPGTSEANRKVRIVSPIQKPAGVMVWLRMLAETKQSNFRGKWNQRQLRKWHFRGHMRLCATKLCRTATKL